jgi:hypothetical protein
MNSANVVISEQCLQERREPDTRSRNSKRINAFGQPEIHALGDIDANTDGKLDGPDDGFTCCLLPD